MTIHATARSPAPQKPGVIEAADLLGGTKVLRAKLSDPFDTHQLLLVGLPVRALTFLIENLHTLQMDGLEKAAGMSLRTFQRRKAAHAKPLSPEQSGRIWKFAEIFARAIKVFGTQEAAETWLECPAYGLERNRPIDLLATPAGAALVETYLGRIEHGVYA